jgi:hypothetical protein
MFEEHQYQNSLKVHFQNTDAACPLLELNVTRRVGRSENNRGNFGSMKNERRRNYSRRVSCYTERVLYRRTICR